MKGYENIIREEKKLSLGEKIRQKRIEHNISQEYLAEYLNVSRQSISKWENGQSNPSTKKLLQISKTLQIEAEELVGSFSGAEESTPGFLVGLEADMESINQLWVFLESIPQDIFQEYNSSFIIYCKAEETQQLQWRKKVEKAVGKKVKLIHSSIVPRSSSIYLFADNKEENPSSFFQFMARQWKVELIRIKLSQEYGTIETEGHQLGDKARQMARHIRKTYYEKLGAYTDLWNKDVLVKISDCLSESGKLRMSDYQDELIERSVIIRLKQNPFVSAEAYLRYLKASLDEQRKLRETVFGNLKENKRGMEELIPYAEELRRLVAGGEILRVWIAGCTHSMEAYLTAILLLENMGEDLKKKEIKVFATDLDERILSEALNGVFSKSMLKNIPGKWIKKYFEKKGEYYQISSAIRGMVIFSVHNILQDPPFSRLDFLICRGIMGNLKEEKRKIAGARFSYALNTGGYFISAVGEEIECLSEYFHREEELPFIYRNMKTRMFFPEQIREPYSAGRQRDKNLSMSKIMEALLMAGMPTGIIFNERYEILYTGQEAGRYLKFQPGKFTKNLFENISPTVAIYVEILLRQMKTENLERTETFIKNNRDSASKEISISLLRKKLMGEDYFLLWFPEIEKKDEISSKPDEGRIGQLEQELSDTKEQMYQLLKELDEHKRRYDLLNEEFQSSNEELILINDELKSTNYELETSNRELSRLNEEYQKKIEIISYTELKKGDLFQLIDAEVIRLDEKCCICKLTEGIPKVTNIRRFDIGRYAGDILLIDGYTAWQEDLKKVKEKHQTVLRIMNGKDDKKLLVEILSDFREDNQKNGYIIFIQIIAKKDKKEETGESAK